MLKSDQNGIEIKYAIHVLNLLVWLKSDQNGIEIFLSPQFSPHNMYVKIRPKWDWNNHMTCSKYYTQNR